MTLKERIDSLAVQYGIKPDSLNDFFHDIFDLTERVAYPENFCPECDFKMTFDARIGKFRCINCGYDGTKKIQIAAAGAPVAATPQATELPADMPDSVKQAFKEAEQVPKQRAKSNGEKMRRLLSKDTAPTQLDEDMIRSVGGIRGAVNWS